MQPPQDHLAVKIKLRDQRRIIAYRAHDSVADVLGTATRGVVITHNITPLVVELIFYPWLQQFVFFHQRIHQIGGFFYRTRPSFAGQARQTSKESHQILMSATKRHKFLRHASFFHNRA